MPRGPQPPIASMPKKMLMSCALPSTIAASTTWPSPDRAALDERGEDAHHDERAAAAEVGEQVDRRDRRVTLGAEVPQHARDREVVDVVADVARERAVLAPPGHARVDEPRVARPARVGPDAEPFGDAGPEAFEQHVGAARTAAARRPAPSGCFRSTPMLRRPRSITEIGDASPPATVRPVATSVAPVDAQHLGAEIGEQHPRELHRPDVRQLDDPDPGERPHDSRARARFEQTRAAFS